MITARLRLSPVSASDLADVFRLYSSPDGWDHPSDRHSSEGHSAAMIARIEEGWRRAGLDYWLACDRVTGDVIGIGGARHRDGGWVLGYRIATPMRGRGFATELATAAVRAARMSEPGRPIIAWIADSNDASKRVAERVGLRDEGLGTDPVDGRRRRAFAWRPVR